MSTVRGIIERAILRELERQSEMSGHEVLKRRDEIDGSTWIALSMEVNLQELTDAVLRSLPVPS